MVLLLLFGFDKIIILVSDGLIIVWIRQDNANQLNFAEAPNFKANSGKSFIKE